MKRILIDDYNQRTCRTGVVGSLATQFGDKALRHGWKILEIHNDRPLAAQTGMEKPYTNKQKDSADTASDGLQRSMHGAGAKHLLDWVRDKRGNVIKRPILKVANTITTMCGGGHTGSDGLGNTTMYVLEICKR